MAEPRWIVEVGIGETRAALVLDGTIIEAAIEFPGGLRAGTVAAGRLADIIVPGRVGLIALSDGGEALVQPLPPGLSQGTVLIVEMTREAIGHKRPLCRVAAGNKVLAAGPDLVARLRGAGLPILYPSTHEDDHLEAAGWSELMEEADTGVIPFPGGGLLMSLTPAMTLFDVDGQQPAEALCVAGAAAAGRAIRRLGIAGSIGIDLPTVANRGVRQAAAMALDAALPQPFERTAVNGFGFLQVVRPQQRASLPHLLAADRTGGAARSLLRVAERTQGHGRRTLVAHPSVIARIEDEPGWLAMLDKRTGTAVALRAAAQLTIFAGYVEAQYP